MHQDLDPGLLKQISQDGYKGLYSQHDSPPGLILHGSHAGFAGF